MEYEAVIGLEVHAHLLTQSKIFCGCATTFGALPNTQICAICLGMPGVLPVLNRRAVEFALKMALATSCRIAPESVFARKNYFYPDLPKGYQISQYELPLAEHGSLEIQVNGHRKQIGITRIHLEEDAGKLVHSESRPVSFVDFNRTGVPLIEIVSEPDLRTPDEAVEYLKGLRNILLYLEICDGNMEEGSLRCDANISLRPVGQAEFGTKTELKNMNSFRFVRQALEYEIRRQRALLSEGREIVQETRLWDAHQGQTFSMRGKEEAHDYRYFPDPDLLPLELAPSLIADLQKSLPELPDEKKARFVRDYALSAYDAGVLVAEREAAEYFEAMVTAGADAKAAANWLINEYFGRLNKQGLTVATGPLSAQANAAILQMVAQQLISGKVAKDVLTIAWTEGGDPREIVERRGLKQVSDVGALEKVVDEIVANNPDKVADAKANPKAIGWFVDQVMKASGGKANPQTVNELLRKRIGA